MKTIDTERLILRGWLLDDLNDLYEYAKNPQVGPMAGWKPHSSKEESLNALKYNMENDNRWAIVLKENEKVIGSINLNPDENRGKYCAKLISFALSADYWGNGYMTEALGVVMKELAEDGYRTFVIEAVEEILQATELSRKTDFSLLERERIGCRK